MTKTGSNSEIQSFKRCRRKWWLSNYRRLELAAAAISGPREIGTRVHTAFADYYVPDGMEPVDPRVSLNKILTDERHAWINDHPDEDTDVLAAQLKQFDKDADLARAMVEGYMEWIAETGADADLIVVAPERAVAHEIMDGVFLLGRLDVLIRRRHDDVLLFMDHKTIGGSFAQATQQLRQDEQMLTYEMLLMLEGGDSVQRVDGALYNMLRKVKRTAAAKPPFYDREEVRHSIHDLRSFWNRTVGTMSDIVAVTDQLDNGADPLRVAYPTPTRDCSWDCDFRAVCPMFDDGSRAEDFLSNFYTIKPENHRYEDVEIP